MADWLDPPKHTEADTLHALVKGTLSLATGGLAGDVFAFLVRAPFERRMEEWMNRVEMRLRHLAARDQQIIRSLPDRDAFISVMIAATQAAGRTHRDDKLQMLAAAVESSAAGVDLDEDMQLLFVRYIDELTATHFALLAFLKEHAEDVARIESYPRLRDRFLTEVRVAISEEQFKLFCNDLASRVLVRFSEGVEDFGGLAERGVVITGHSDEGRTVVVTPIGLALLEFVQDRGRDPAI